MATKNSSQTMQQKQIGSHLQALRKKAGFKSAASFAKHVGVNPNTYTQYEQGLVSFSYAKAWLFADALDCTLDELGGRTPPKESGLATDPEQIELIGYYDSMNSEGRDALIKSARLMSGSPDVRVEKNRPEDIAIPPEVAAG